MPVKPSDWAPFWSLWLDVVLSQQGTGAALQPQQERPDDLPAAECKGTVLLCIGKRAPGLLE